MTLPFFTPPKITTEQPDRVPKENMLFLRCRGYVVFKIATEHDRRYKRLDTAIALYA